MNRKITFLIVLFGVFALGMHAQHGVNTSSLKGPSKVNSNSPEYNERAIASIVFSEDFSAGGFANWTVMGEGQDNWIESQTNQAGGDIPEVQMYYNPIFTGVSRFVSPVINTTGNTELLLSFLHVLDLWGGGGGFWVSVETTSDGGTTWNPVWEMEYTSTDDYYAMEVIAIETADVGSANFQFCFKFEDNSDLIDWWSIDNIVLEDPYSYDVGPLAIYGLDSLIFNGDDLYVSADIVNYGTETATFDVQLDIDDGTNVVYTTTETITDLGFGEVTMITFDPWTSVEGNYTATVTTLLSGDENAANDETEKDFIVYSNNTYCFPGGDCSWGDGFTDFAFAGIENYGSGCSSDGYGDFTAMEGTVEIGSTYTATFSSGYSSNYASMWIDFNQNFEFEEFERVLTDFPLGDAGELMEVDITIPGYGMPGTTTMRIGSNYGDISSPDPCAIFTYGEWEDYTLTVTGTSVSYDAAVLSIDMMPVVQQGSLLPKATVKNEGVETISFPVTFSTTGYTSTVDVTDLAMGSSVQVEFDVWNATPDNYVMEVSTDLTGDENPDNDTMEQEIAVIEYAPDKMVLGEEGTGTWCGWCIRGLVYMDSMAMKYPDTWIGVAVHNGDPMVVPEYDAGIGPLISNAYPGGLVDRAIYCDPSTFEEAFLERIEIVPPAGVMIENKSYNSATRELTFSVSAEFIANVSDFRLNAVLVENEVRGTGDGYAQANYYAGGTYGPMGGYENMPNPIPAEDMVYEDVARAILGGFEGQEGSLPAQVNSGETHSWEFTTTLDEEWDANHVRIIGMVMNYATGDIENATIEDLIVGLPEEEELARNVNVYPNPARDLVRITNAHDSQINIYSIDGSLVFSHKQGQGDCIVNISGLTNGTYIIKVISERSMLTKKVVVLR